MGWSREEVARYKDKKRLPAPDIPVGKKRLKKKKKPWVIEYRWIDREEWLLKLFPKSNDWRVWNRYHSIEAARQAIEKIQRKNMWGQCEYRLLEG